MLFRADGIDRAFEYYQAMFDFTKFGFDRFRLTKEGLVLFGVFVIWALPNSFEVVGYKDEVFKKRVWVYILGGVLLFVALKMMAEIPSREFVYFKF